MSDALETQLDEAQAKSRFRPVKMVQQMGLLTKSRIIQFLLIFGLFKLVAMQQHDDFDFVGLSDQHSSAKSQDPWWKRLVWETFVLCVYAFIWVVIHMVMYRYTPMPSAIAAIRHPGEQIEEFNSYISYLPALIHAPVTTAVGLYGFYHYTNKYGEPATGWQWFPSYFSASFFIHDGLIGWYHGYLDPLMQAHHILMVLVVIWGIVVGDGYGKDLCYGIAIGEITNPLYSMHMIFEWHEFPDPIVQAIGVIFIFAFFIARAVVMPVEVYRFQLGHSDLLFKLTYTGMWVISMLLVWRMLNKVSKMGHKMIPGNKPLKAFYDLMVKLRPYQLHYGVLVSILGTAGVWQYYLTKA